MDTENLKSWASQPDVCRCCLSSNGTRDLLAAYISDAGEKEIYSELLLSCFGISLSLLSEWGPCHLMCDLCVDRLHNANTFKKQVLQAEKYYTTYVNSKHDTDDIKTEVATSNIGNSECKQIIDLKHETIVAPENEDNDWHSDTEILESQSQKNYTENDPENEYGPYVEVNRRDVSNTVPQIIRPLKPLSERKRIKTTCEIILKHTTACPFRHHKSWFQCFFCTQTFMEISTLKTHSIQNHGNIDEEINKLKRYPRSLQIEITDLQCTRCGININSIDNLRQHFKETHNQVVYKECIADYIVNSAPYTCHICKQQFHVFRTLTTHFNEHYANYICDICGKSFINSKRLKVHNRTHEIGLFPCAECGKVLKTKASKANHMESHSKRVLKCQICAKPMKHYNDRIKHMSDEHNITHRFKCPICSREYNIKHYLATHIRQTHGNKNKKCSECNMAFITNHGLKKHMQKHSGLKAFSCDVCNKTYARNYSLREHMRIHETKALVSS